MAVVTGKGRFNFYEAGADGNGLRVAAHFVGEVFVGEHG